MCLEIIAVCSLVIHFHITRVDSVLCTHIPFRYADLMVHRLLAVTISADATYPDLLDKHRSQVLCNNLNYRHKMAQYAGRASMSLYTQVGMPN